MNSVDYQHSKLKSITLFEIPRRCFSAQRDCVFNEIDKSKQSAVNFDSEQRVRSHDPSVTPPPRRSTLGNLFNLFRSTFVLFSSEITLYSVENVVRAINEEKFVFVTSRTNKQMDKNNPPHNLVTRLRTQRTLILSLSGKHD